MSGHIGRGPGTVTLFGDDDVLHHALAVELGRRGNSTHLVSVAAGWLNSVTHAIVRADSSAGSRALEGLTIGDRPPAHVVAVSPTPVDEVASEELTALCRRCSDQHDVALIFHPPLGRPAAQPGGAEGTGIPAAEFAVAVADAIEEHWTSGPAFTSVTYTPAAGHAPPTS